MPNHVKDIHLESLHDGIPAITERAAGFFQENSMVCFHDQGHGSGVVLNVIDVDGSDHSFRIHWTGEVTPQLLRNYTDINKKVDFAACSIALLLVRELTECTAIEQAMIGTTIDYWLSPKSQQDDDDLIFNHAARLEVSGIMKETKKHSIKGRINSKQKRLSKGLPALVIVTEFHRPCSQIECYE